ncbi:MAG: PRC-barrel domain-containing protein [Actinobacteria bacterium]|nr:PRC-barrel domain-containing protein [Actinomycetota bacterium]
MADETQFTIGARVHGQDGVTGRLIWVVADRARNPWIITQLVVEPTHRTGLGRFVPLNLVTGVDAGGDITISCTADQFEQLESAEETQYVPGSGAYPLFGPTQFLAAPYYTSDVSIAGDEVPFTAATVTADAPLPNEADVAVHAVPVEATDGRIGEVEGLVIDPATHQVTHVLLREGHLWGRKDVAVPLSAVRDFDRADTEPDVLRVSLTKQEVGDLPEVPVGRARR